jgi:hypothetical protein
MRRPNYPVPTVIVIVGIALLCALISVDGKRNLAESVVRRSTEDHSRNSPQDLGSGGIETRIDPTASARRHQQQLHGHDLRAAVVTARAPHLPDFKLVWHTTRYHRVPSSPNPIQNEYFSIFLSLLLSSSLQSFQNYPRP